MAIATRRIQDQMTLYRLFGVVFYVICYRFITPAPWYQHRKHEQPKDKKIKWEVMRFPTGFASDSLGDLLNSK